MPRDSFTAFVLEQLTGAGAVFCKPMFDSFGFYLDGKFFAIAHKGSLFFKTSKKTRQAYEEYGSKPFAPGKGQVLKNYYEVPPDILEDSVALREWARLAAEAGE